MERLNPSAGPKEVESSASLISPWKPFPWQVGCPGWALSPGLRSPLNFHSMATEREQCYFMLIEPCMLLPITCVFHFSSLT